MANTYSQIYIQVIFAVSNRNSFIPKNRKEELHKYICGIINKRGQKPIAIGSVPNHIHILIGLLPSIALSDLVRDIKAGSSKFINDEKWIKYKFGWQNGFGGFSYSKSQLDNVVNYINNQEEHHKKISFREEYISFLKKFEVEYDEKYLFDFLD